MTFYRVKSYTLSKVTLLRVMHVMTLALVFLVVNCFHIHFYVVRCFPS